MHIQLDTKIDELELAPKLETRLKLCKAETFADVMQINAADWANVTPKVVNALRRFQSSNRQHYINLGGKPLQRAAESRQRRRSGNDEQRFFVANNILNAYASAGRLFGIDQPIDEVMAEIMEAADAFMLAFNGPKEAPVEVKAPAVPEVLDDAQPAAIDDVPANDAPVEAEHASDVAPRAITRGDRLRLTQYLSSRRSSSATLRVGAIADVISSVTDADGVVTVKARIDNRHVTFKSTTWAWEIAD